MNADPDHPTDLPPGWVARVPEPDDTSALAVLVRDHRRSVTGQERLDEEAAAFEAVGIGSWTRRQWLACDPGGAVRAWARVHDRAAGRTIVTVTVAPDFAEADEVAGAAFRWAAHVARIIATERGLVTTQLDSSAYAADERQRRWLTEAAYDLTRTWLQMTRPVTAAEGQPGALPPHRAGIAVRPVAEHEDGLPVAGDLRTVHRLLEESFADHFNSYRESFPEFVARLREEPGHRWDHWFIATITDDHGVELPAGAVVSSVMKEDPSGAGGSSIDYIGVHRRARGRGVAKSLLYTVIADAASRGRNRVALEVDADSPTGADGLYASLGWETTYRTESWHGEVTTISAP